MFLIDHELKFKKQQHEMELIIKKVWNERVLIINHKTFIMKVVLDFFHPSVVCSTSRLKHLEGLSHGWCQLAPLL